MIDLNDLRARPEEYQRACNNKGIKLDVQSFLKLDEEQRSLKQEVESLRALQNRVSKELPKLSGAEKEEKLTEMKSVAETLKEKVAIHKEVEAKWEATILRFPSIPLAKVPIGPNEDSNVEIKRWGAPRSFDFKPLDHIELGKALDILDVERGVKVAGSRSYFVKGDGVRLQHALMQLALDLLVERGYTLMDPPHIVKYEMMMGTGYFPGGEEQAYHLDSRDDGYYLIGTSEVSVCAYHQGEILAEEELPKRYAGYSPCYRREAGTYGKDTQGIYRVHQFYKVEQVVLCKNDPDESARFHAELLKNAEDLMQLLGLHYRVLDLSTGDMGQGQVYKNDIEAWIPSRSGFGETHSCSTFYEFQSRRLNIRYKNSTGKNIFCHTLNNTLIASSRALIAILENYQNADRSVTVPEVLRKYMGGLEVIKAKTSVDMD